MQVEEFALIVKEGLILRVYVQPGASRSELSGLRREELAGKQIERLRIRLRAQAQEGAANQALIEFLADLCLVPKSSISLTSGQSSRGKTLLIAGPGAKLKDRVLKQLEIADASG
jgi:uncharacterized protein (TIGR00251 family)